MTTEQTNGDGGKIRLGITLSSVTGFQIAVAFGIQWYTVLQLGAGAETDALFAGATLAQLATSLGIETLSFALVPMLSAQTEEERRRSAWTLLLAMGLLFGVLSLALAIAAPLLVPLIVPGFSNETRQLTVALARIQLIGLTGAACYAVMAALYQARERFVRVELSFLFCLLGGGLLLVWGLPRYGVPFAAWVQVGVNTGPAVLLLPGLGRYGRSERPFDVVMHLGRRMRALVAGTAYYRTGFVVDRILASFLSPGSVVILDLAQRLHAAIVRVMNQGIVTPILPRLSRLAQERNWQDFQGVLRERLTGLFRISGALVLMLLAATLWGREWAPSVHSLRELTGWASDNALKTWNVFVCLSGVLLCASMVHALTIGFYAQGNTATPTAIGVAAYTVCLALKLAGFFVAGLWGIALAVSAYYVSHGLLLRHYFHRRLARLQQESVRALPETPGKVPGEIAPLQDPLTARSLRSSF